eukprot:SAG22_NODE_550_length_9202_cov_30.666484_6_plen_64_part_00
MHACVFSTGQLAALLFKLSELASTYKQLSGKEIAVFVTAAVAAQLLSGVLMMANVYSFSYVNF